MAIDSSGAGTEIQCPSCGQKITIPADATPPPQSAPAAPAGQPAGHSITSSAAAKIEMHLKVPVRDQPGEVLITKPKLVAEEEIKDPNKKIRMRTIRHSTCIENGHDKFDERVTEFLHEVGEASLISVHTVGYTYFDVGTQKILTDFGVLVFYRG